MPFFGSTTWFTTEKILSKFGRFRDIYHSTLKFAIFESLQQANG